MNDKDLVYHWYDEPDKCFVTVNKSKLKQLFVKLPKLSFLSYKNKKIRVDNLKKFCNLLGIGYEGLERKIAIKITKKVKFPIKLNVPEFATIIAAVTNEGHLKSGRWLFEYYNKDPLLHEIVRSYVFKIFGIKMNTPKPKGNALRSYSYGIAARALLKVGVMQGSKVRVNSPLPNLIKQNGLDMLKPYFTQLLAEEMSTYFKFKEKKYLDLCIRYGRSIDVTKELKEKLNILADVYEQIPISRLPIDVQEKIKKISLFLIEEEKELLNSIGITSYLKPSCAYRVKRENCIRIHWNLLIEKSNSVELFYQFFVPMIENEKLPIKLREAIEKFKIWKSYRGRKLTEEEIGVIKEVSKKWENIKSGMLAM